MAIKVRRGNFADFDKNKLVAGEFALVLDRGIPTGEVYFCVSPGNIRKLATIEELQALLNASGATYTALQQLITDLNNNPNQLTNILNNISALQSGKIDKTSIVQTTATNDSTKVPSSAVTYGLANQITQLNDKLVNLKSTEVNGNYGSTIKINKRNGVCEAYVFILTTDTLPQSWATLGTFPDYKAIKNTSSTTVTFGNVPLSIGVTTNGVIQVYARGVIPAGSIVEFTLTYLSTAL